jgi:hypothetical protein
MMAAAAPLVIPLLIAGTTVQAVSTIQQGRAAKKQGEFQAKIAARNAEQSIKDAEGKRTAASEAAIQRERQGSALKARQRALFAKSGVELRGSPLSVLVETAQDTEADRLTILREGAIAGASDEFRAGVLTAQGRAARARGSAAQRASILSAVGTGASGFAQAGLASSRFKSPGTTSTGSPASNLRVSRLQSSRISPQR